MQDENKIYYIYKITNNVNNKVYIGLTNDHEHRLYQYKWNAKHKSDDRPILRAFNKYGFENFDFEVIATANSLQNINELEDILIKQYNAQDGDFGYNINNGGLYSPRTPETCQKISEALKKYYETHSNHNKGKLLPEEWKKNISEASFGKPGTNLGKAFTNEWCSNLSNSNTGKKHLTDRKFKPEVEKEICRLYVEENKTIYHLGKIFNAYRSVIIAILDRNSIQRRKSQYTGHPNGRNKFTKDQELEICRLFVEERMAQNKIGVKFGCKGNTIGSILFRNGVDTKNRIFKKDKV